MKERIDITMTAVLRSSILDKTLKSFHKNVFYKDIERYRLIVNIDPVGDNEKFKNITRVCKSYFDDVSYNMPRKPSFPKAVIWTWSQVKANWVFHLEDDWIIHRKIDIDDMINILKERPPIACLRLCKFPISNSKRPKLFNCRYDYNKRGSFLLASDRKKQFGLNPVLIRGSFVKGAVPQMVDYKNPEKQFRYGNELMRDFVMKWEYAIYGKPGDSPLVTDHGLEWRIKHKLIKPRNSQFLVWGRGS